MGRRPEDNPFTPGFGNLPRVFAGRRVEFADLDLMVSRLAKGIYEQARLVTADRGFGKTTLLRELEEEQTEAGRWVVRAAATRGDAVIGRLCRQLADLLHEHDLAGSLSRAGADALRRLAGITIGPVAVETTPVKAAPDAGAELERLLSAVARLAAERDTVLLLLVDEAQNIGLEALGALFYAIQEVQGQVIVETDPVTGATRRDALPFGVVVAGLPGLVGRLKTAGSTFGERSKPLPLEAFGEADMREGLRALVQEGGAGIDEAAIDLLMAACGGYPYFLHVFGQHAWNAGAGEVVTADDATRGIAQAAPIVTEFYEARLRELTDKQRRYLDAAAELDDDERSSRTVADLLERTSSSLGSTQQALIERHGLLRARGDGRLAFTLPGLDRYLQQGPRA